MLRSLVRLAISSLLLLGVLATPLLGSQTRAQTTTDSSPAGTAAASPPSAVPIGTELTIRDTVKVTVVKFTPDVTERAMQEPTFANPPESGYVYVAATFSLTYTGPQIDPDIFGNGVWNLISATVSGPSGDMPMANFTCESVVDGSVSGITVPEPGQTYQFDMCFSVPKSEVPFLVLTVSPQELAGSGGQTASVQLGDTPLAEVTPTVAPVRSCQDAIGTENGTEDAPLYPGDCAIVDGFTIILRDVNTDAGDAYELDPSIPILGSDPLSDPAPRRMVVLSFEITNGAQYEQDASALSISFEPIGWETESNNCYLAPTVPNATIGVLQPGETATLVKCWFVPTDPDASFVIHILSFGITGDAWIRLDDRP